VARLCRSKGAYYRTERERAGRVERASDQCVCVVGGWWIGGMVEGVKWWIE
jgi:hypothetical protein